jgi:N-acyl-phosphatidylethanolamine-hydrolysing phospholipase D
MRHWTNRSGDRDETLWCGYSETSRNNGKKFLFPGDTAWFEELGREVGERYGPFDVAAIPIGAYEPRDVMKMNHINVEEAIMMKDAVQAKMAVPIHWGTFPLTLEPIMEPREKLQELMAQRDDQGSFVPWLIGETKQSNS